MIHHRSTLVQCKQWRKQRVGVGIVRELYGIVSAEKADNGIVVTSGSYTQEARKFAARVPVEWVDGGRLQEMISILSGDTQGETATKSINTSVETERECPRCGSWLVKKIAKRGRYAGSTFYGCSSFPMCRQYGTRRNELTGIFHTNAYRTSTGW